MISAVCGERRSMDLIAGIDGCTCMYAMHVCLFPPQHTSHVDMRYFSRITSCSTNRPITSSCWVQLLNQTMIFIQYYVRIVMVSRRSIFLHFYRNFHNRIGKPWTQPCSCEWLYVMTSTCQPVRGVKNSAMDILVEKKFASGTACHAPDDNY
jgi:hypothetical protein